MLLLAAAAPAAEPEAAQFSEDDSEAASDYCRSALPIWRSAASQSSSSWPGSK